MQYVKIDLCSIAKILKSYNETDWNILRNQADLDPDVKDLRYLNYADLRKRKQGLELVLEEFNTSNNSHGSGKNLTIFSGRIKSHMYICLYREKPAGVCYGT